MVPRPSGPVLMVSSLARLRRIHSPRPTFWTGVWARLVCARGRVCDAGALVAYAAVEGLVMVPEKQAALVAAVADGVGGELSGHNDQSLGLLIWGRRACRRAPRWSCVACGGC